ncbi:MAG TPA: cyclic nucleotide-binding domain-containing protein [Planctomycetota bacterium]|nr:cyclic nucleotide-binding domain-containing protein [Planctomycetota bacterium]
MTIFKTVKHVEKDIPILVEGQASNHQIFFLVKGTAVVEVKGSVVGTVNAGEWFGELAAILHTPRTATVRAVTPCEVQVFTGPDDDNLYEQMSRDPKMMRRLVEQLCNRLQETSKRHSVESAELAATAGRYRKAISGTMFALERLVEKYKSKVMEEVLQHLSSRSGVTTGEKADADPGSFPTSKSAIFG